MRIDADGNATVFTGKVELGQGILTALAQIAAEELDLPLARVEMISGDTGRTPNEGQTAGSQSIENSGTALRWRAPRCARSCSISPPRSSASAADHADGHRRRHRAPDGRKVGYGELAGEARSQSRGDAPRAAPKPPASHKIVGKSDRRASTFRPRSPAARPTCRTCACPACCTAAWCARRATARSWTASTRPRSKAMPGVVAVVRDGSFLGVVAEREEQAIKAREALARKRRNGSADRNCPTPRASTTSSEVAAEQGRDHRRQAGAAAGRAPTTLEATYTKPYMAHASIGPSCAVARVQGRQA